MLKPSRYKLFKYIDNLQKQKEKINNEWYIGCDNEKEKLKTHYQIQKKIDKCIDVFRKKGEGPLILLEGIISKNNFEKFFKEIDMLKEENNGMLE